MCLGDRDYETSNRRSQCWKPPHHSQHTPTAAQIQRFFKTRGYLPLTRYQWACTNSLKFICQWKFTSAQKVKCAWQLFSLLSWFVRLAVKGWIVCVFSVSLCLLQSRGEHHLFLHLTGTSFSPPLLQPNPCRKKIKNSICFYLTQSLAWGIRYWAP